MRTWINVYLPLLPLETIRPRWCDPGSHVILARERVLAMSPQAAASGVRIGMRRASVQSLCPDATLHERDEMREQDALNHIAISLLQYTPEVTFAEECSLLLDVTASLRAFGGRLRLCRLVQNSVTVLGFTARIGMAPTGQGAWLLARDTRRRRVVRMENLLRCLDNLPCTLLPSIRPYTEWLSGIGCHTLGALRKLPRAGLLRRTNAKVLAAVDRAYGQAPELFKWVQAPKQFSSRLELPDRIEHAEAALFAARRLLLQMTGWLVAQQLAVSRFVLLLEHERGRAAIPPTPVEIALAEPVWQEEHLTRLLKERLSRITLNAPLIGLRLEAMQVEAMRPPTESLFPEPGGTASDYHRLLELLKARLGDGGVLVPHPQADHRPEVRNTWRRFGTNTSSVASMLAYQDRPFWLLEQPLALSMQGHRPFYGSPLKILKGPERIECGWWDGMPVQRDYFIAQGETQIFYWIYRQRHQEDVSWFLHGLFG